MMFFVHELCAVNAYANTQSGGSDNMSRRERNKDEEDWNLALCYLSPVSKILKLNKY